ncbi:MAG: hypothetical protein ABR986_00850 [Methanomassiliicoccales archaeon]
MSSDSSCSSERIFENGLHTAFLVFFAISLIAMVVMAFNLKESASGKSSR